MKKLSVLCVFCSFSLSGWTQTNPYEGLGEQGEKLGSTILTLSNGRYNEFFDADTIVRIGTILYHVVTQKVVGFVDHDVAYSENSLKPEIVSMWLSPDPLARKFPEVSPYNFVKNNPLRYVDPDGRFPIDIHIRSFAPYKLFGGVRLLAWHGDNRGFSNLLSASSRIGQVSSYETTTRSGLTKAYGNISSSTYGAFAYSEAYVNGGQNAPIENGNINTHLYGNNDALFVTPMGMPLDGGPSWDIDVHSNLDINVTNGENGNQILSIVGAISGDQFPNAESFVNDADGNSIFLGAFATKSRPDIGPFVTLMGDKNKQMFNVNISSS